MLAPGKSARSTASYNWFATSLGDPASWPHPLHLATDILLNTPLPMLLAWGADSIVVFNEAYAKLAGPGYGTVPGGAVPPVLPPPLAAAGAELARAWQGEAAVAPSVALSFAHAGGATEEIRDVHFTPVRMDNGAVRGVLCAIAPAGSDPQPEDQGGALRVLVVEDNLDSQYLVCEMLKAFGHRAEGVAHPEDALARLGSARYDVLFSDVSLPGMSGVDLARKALAGDPGLKVIFASGYGDALLRHLEFPYLSLQKPYELDQLQGALDDVARQLHRKT
ncbi:response regulator [Massilia horti]|uniref:Response regulator n=1 Tax=Massilia horti TaxID=2562153 RepID=A0A4Y9SRX1_9BURK|nr:response regulator [Massilia horti]TFW27954.1 response regulator [Massilia horti]